MPPQICAGWNLDEPIVAELRAGAGSGPGSAFAGAAATATASKRPPNAAFMRPPVGPRGMRGGLRRSYHARIGSSCFCPPARSDPGQTGLDALVTLIGGPQVERQRDQIVDLGDGPRVERQIDGLHVQLARLAGLDPRRGRLLVLEGGQQVRVGLAA